MSSPSGLTPRRSEPVRIVEMVFPNATNHYGTMFGGKVLELMDRAAFLAASRFTRQTIVTASTERIDFHLPIKHGSLVELVATVVFTGRTSVTVKVDLFAEDPTQGLRERASSGYFHMVAVSPDGKPIPVPSMVVDTPEAQVEWDMVQSLRGSGRQRRSHA